ncbi:hypothetical protein [Micromonospora sp. WMMD714]|uniref:hypothetical protein n=1 Tax=Micromonospora sp. WMMD714 TaxID=3016097 RepID=UPI00249ABFB6|nr:hypothetical protein [Micromonospora sp. WMMD714]WFE63121.1 hypothetical protein O7625_07360 [Micromonospora sp. WMMD714]
MTGRKHGAVDHDLLADYVGGALDGTPEQLVVARLLTEDPAWAQAYAVLAPAVARVHDDLAGWGATMPEMPPVVVERLAAALAGAGPAPTEPAAPTEAAEASEAAGTSGAAGAVEGAGASEIVGAAGTERAGAAGVRERSARTGQPVPAQPGGRRTPGTRAGDGRTDPSGPGRRRRWTRLAGPVGLAAATLAAVGFGVAQLVDGTTGRESPASTMAGPAQDNAESAGRGFRFTGEPQRSGVDWSPATLGGASVEPLSGLGTPSAVQPGSTTQASPTAPERPEDKRRSTPGGLDRLTARAALDTCLAEISTEHGRGPVTVEVVDYATFNGEPALVVRFADPGGDRWAWVSGAECGVPGSGADTRYRSRVG